MDLKEIFYDADKPILKNFRFKLEKGKVVALVGPSGSGKTTVLKIIAGLHKGFKGEFSTGDMRVSLIPQSNGLLPWKTVYENIVILKQLENKNVDNEKAARLIESLGLKGLENQYPNKLSGGQYQRVVIGQAFFYEPDVLLMDEPFSALDVETKREVQDIFLNLQKQNEIAAVFVTHILDEANYLNAEIFDLRNVVGV